VKAGKGERRGADGRGRSREKGEEAAERGRRKGEGHFIEVYCV
jgi:hypothetical protein